MLTALRPILDRLILALPPLRRRFAALERREAERRLRLLPAGGALRPLPAQGPGPFPRAGIVIVSYHGLEYLRQCLDSVLHRTGWPEVRVVVVDNGSDAATQAHLRAAAAAEPRLQALFNGRNLGFAAANNIGLRLLADCEYLVLLNNDTVVPPGWLGQLIGHAAREDVGLAGPVTNWTGNEARIPASYGTIAEMEEFARTWTERHRGRVFDIGVLAMFCVAMRREVFLRAGELDERYGVGMFEDVDYAERVRALGLRVVCCEDAFVHHYGMASFARIDPAEYDRIFAANRAYFREKWGRSWQPSGARGGSRPR
jgi:GT2 family glycosyltransferase